MGLSRSIGARKNTAGDGTSARDLRLALARLFTGAGVLPGAPSPLVTGTAAWEYSVAGPAGFVTSYSVPDGVHLFRNDGGETVATGAAPGTGSRIDVIWVEHLSNGENGATTSTPVFGVTQGVASGTPVKPSIPTAALELATAVVASGSANTAAATITQTAAAADLVRRDVALPHLRLTQTADQSRTGGVWGQANLASVASTSGDQPWTHSAGAVTLTEGGLFALDTTITMKGATFTVQIIRTGDAQVLAQSPTGTAPSFSNTASTVWRLNAGDVIVSRVNPTVTLEIEAHEAAKPSFLSITRLSV